MVCLVVYFRTFCLPSSKLCRLICRYFSFSLFVIACLNESCFMGISGNADSAPSSTVLTTRLLPTCFAMPEPSTSWTFGVWDLIISRSCVAVFCLVFFEVVVFGGMCFVFTITVPFCFSMGSVLVVSSISKPMRASAFPVSIRGVWIFSLIFAYATMEPPRCAMPWISETLTS